MAVAVSLQIGRDTSSGFPLHLSQQDILMALTSRMLTQHRSLSAAERVRAAAGNQPATPSMPQTQIEMAERRIQGL